MILITITCAAYFTLLIRDSVILTFNWQRPTVWLDSSNGKVLVQGLGFLPSWQGSDSSVDADQTSKG